MWQILITGIIVAAAVAAVVHYGYRSITRKGGACCSGCPLSRSRAEAKPPGQLHPSED